MIFSTFPMEVEVLAPTSVDIHRMNTRGVYWQQSGDHSRHTVLKVFLELNFKKWTIAMNIWLIKKYRYSIVKRNIAICQRIDISSHTFSSHQPPSLTCQVGFYQCLNDAGSGLGGQTRAVRLILHWSISHQSGRALWLHITGVISLYFYAADVSPCQQPPPPPSTPHSRLSTEKDGEASSVSPTLPSPLSSATPSPGTPGTGRGRDTGWCAGLMLGKHIQINGSVRGWKRRAAVTRGNKDS